MSVVGASLPQPPAHLSLFSFMFYSTMRMELDSLTDMSGNGNAYES